MKYFLSILLFNMGFSIAAYSSFESAAQYAQSTYAKICGGGNGSSKLQGIVSNGKEITSGVSSASNLIPSNSSGSDSKKSPLEVFKNVVGVTSKAFSFMANPLFNSSGGSSQSGKKCRKKISLEKLCDIGLITGTATSFIINRIQASKQKKILESQPLESIGHEQYYAQANIYKEKVRMNSILQGTSIAMSVCYGTALGIILTKAALGTAGESTSRILPLGLKVAGTIAAAKIFDKKKKSNKKLRQENLRNATLMQTPASSCDEGSACFCAQINNDSPEYNQHCIDQYIASTYPQSAGTCSGQSSEMCECLQSGTCFKNQVQSISPSSASFLKKLSNEQAKALNQISAGLGDKISEKSLSQLKNQALKSLVKAESFLKKNKKFQTKSNAPELQSFFKMAEKINTSKKINSIAKRKPQSGKSLQRQNLKTRSPRLRRSRNIASNNYLNKDSKFFSQNKSLNRGGIENVTYKNQSSLRRGKSLSMDSIFKQISKTYEKEAI